MFLMINVAAASLPGLAVEHTLKVPCVASLLKIVVPAGDRADA